MAKMKTLGDSIVSQVLTMGTTQSDVPCSFLVNPVRCDCGQKGIMLELVNPDGLGHMAVFHADDIAGLIGNIIAMCIEHDIPVEGMRQMAPVSATIN